MYKLKKLISKKGIIAVIAIVVFFNVVKDIKIAGILDGLLGKVILNRNGDVLSENGDPKIRDIQIDLNKKYSSYSIIRPCDGIFSKQVNILLRYGVQVESGLTGASITGEFRNGEIKSCPNLSEGSDKTNLVKLVQYALYCNGYNKKAKFDGKYDNYIANEVKKFQEFMCLENQDGKADRYTIMSLILSNGNPDRKVIAGDASVKYTKKMAKDLVNNHKYEYIGRYIVEDERLPKSMSRKEAKMLLDTGLKIFPIYQMSAKSAEYFSREKGNEDAINAVVAAMNLGIPYGSYIYFAVDYETEEDDVIKNVVPYFEAINERMKALGGKYKISVYGSRRACTVLYEKGLTETSFLADESWGWGSNSAPMPKNWAIQQIKNDISLDDVITGIDKDVVSGRDKGVSKLDETIPKTDYDTIAKASGYNN